MKQILWFRRDLRITDSAILSNAKDEVLPIFIFDKNILNNLDKDDKRVTFIYQSVLNLKEKLKSIGLDLAIFYDYPQNVFNKLKNFDEVLCSCDFDAYAIKRDLEIEKIIPLKRFYDSFLVHPTNALKADNTPYKVFTPYYKSLKPLYDSDKIIPYEIKNSLKLSLFNYTIIPTLEELGFEKQQLPTFLSKSANELLEIFVKKIEDYEHNRDYFFLNATSNLAVHLRFGLISPKEVFNYVKGFNGNEYFIKELFWREFYNYILYYYPQSEYKNWNGKEIVWSENKEHFKAWCEGMTGVPIIDSAMRYLNQTGLMHNRLRMVVSSYLTKNLFLPWSWGEKYFAKKLLDYEASSNIGSWQWSASTGADSVPYFRVFNPYLQSQKFDKDGLFIKSVLKELKDIDPKLFHKENGVQSNIFVNYPNSIVDIKKSKENAISAFRLS